MTLPAPPAALPPRPRLYEVAEGDLLVRFYNPLHGGWDARRSFGPLPGIRFDHHRPPPGSGVEGYPDVRGFRWRGRQAGSICFVLNDRTDMSALEAIIDRDLGDPEIWTRIARAARRCHIRIVSPW